MTWCQTHSWVEPYSPVDVIFLGAVCAENGREGSPLDPSGEQLRSSRSQMASNVMTPVAKSHICGPQSEIDLEVKRLPALGERPDIQIMAKFGDSCRHTHRNNISREANLIPVVAQPTPAVKEKWSDLQTEVEEEGARVRNLGSTVLFFQW